MYVIERSASQIDRGNPRQIAEDGAVRGVGYGMGRGVFQLATSSRGGCSGVYLFLYVRILN